MAQTAKALARASVGAVMLLGLTAQAPTYAASGMTVERVVMVMRHGVRPPTKEPALPRQIAPDPWPRWPVAPGWLTPHGAAAIRLLGKDDRANFTEEGLLPTAGCPAEGSVAVRSDSDERTIATGDAYLQGLAPGCMITNRHLAQDAPDPLFHDPAVGSMDPAKADRAILEALGPDGIFGAERRERPALRTLDRILCGDRAARCGVSSTSSAVIPATTGKPPKISGALEWGSSAAQSILLEYADGKPMSEVGWGRTTSTDIAIIGALHSEGFAIHARPPVLAAANAAGIANTVIEALRSGSAKITVIVGHDTNVANFAGLLDLHWQVPGFAADDPAPGGALIFELVRDSSARSFVRLAYRSQTLQDIRVLSADKAMRKALPVAGCGGLSICALDVFSRLLSR